MKAKKNRNIPFAEYFAILQKEYLVAELRGSIYKKPKDKEYYLQREMPLKRQTIESIASKNNFKSIFSCPALMQQYRDEIYNIWGLPNFVYRSNEDRRARRKQDVLSYFCKDLLVSVLLDNGEIGKGKIHYTDLEACIVRVRVEGKKVDFPYEKVARIF